MSDGFNVNLIHDDSVTRVINKTAKNLQKKYTAERQVDERVLKRWAKWKVVLTKTIEAVCGVIFLCSLFVFIVGLNSKFQGVCPNICGYSAMRIQSESMTSESIDINGTKYGSGFEVGDAITTKKVDTDTLNVGDKIAFYVYYPDFKNLKIEECVKDEGVKTTKFESVSIANFFGFQSSKIREAGKNDAKLVFHHIVEIYKDENGKRWFVTKGSAREEADEWFISEDMVVGLYDDSKTASFANKIMTIALSKGGFLILLSPAIILALALIFENLRIAELNKLEKDCVEEKRKITDPICVRNKIGYRMKRKTKYKILAQANQEDVGEYITLLWKNGSAPASIRKYYSTKTILLVYNKKMLELNRACEMMIKNNEHPVRIAKFYTAQKTKIERDRKRTKDILAQLKKKNAK